ncbi:hypothetical protein [Halobacillus sp. B29]
MKTEFICGETFETLEDLIKALFDDVH